MKKEWKYHPEGCDNCGSEQGQNDNSGTHSVH